MTHFQQAVLSDYFDRKVPWSFAKTVLTSKAGVILDKFSASERARITKLHAAQFGVAEIRRRVRRNQNDLDAVMRLWGLKPLVFAAQRNAMKRKARSR